METITRILLFTDRQKQQELVKEIETAQAKCNFLIQIYEKFQPWCKITTPELWLELVKDFADLYDKTLIAHTEIRAEGVTASAAAIANLFNLDRDNFLNIATGKIKKSTAAIDYSEFKEYEKFLLFQNGVFELSDSAIDKAKEKFKSVEYYKKMADQHTRDEFQLNIKEKMSDSSVKTLITQREGVDTEVYFIE